MLYRRPSTLWWIFWDYTCTYSIVHHAHSNPLRKSTASTRHEPPFASSVCTLLLGLSTHDGGILAKRGGSSGLKKRRLEKAKLSCYQVYIKPSCQGPCMHANKGWWSRHGGKAIDFAGDRSLLNAVKTFILTSSRRLCAVLGHTWPEE